MEVLNSQDLLHNVAVERPAAAEETDRIEGHFEENRKDFFAFVDEAGLVVEVEAIQLRLHHAIPVLPEQSHMGLCTSEEPSESPSRRWGQDSNRLAMVCFRHAVVGLKEDSRDLLVSQPPRRRVTAHSGFTTI